MNKNKALCVICGSCEAVAEALKSSIPARVSGCHYETAVELLSDASTYRPNFVTLRWGNVYLHLEILLAV
jgi:hypothetical protein